MKTSPLKKKIVLIILFLFAFGILYSDAPSDIKRFNPISTKELNISLSSENLTISSTEEAEIIIITETSDNSLNPKINLQNNSLSITNQTLKNQEKSFCDITILLPADCCFNSVDINNITGNLNIEHLNCQSLIIQTDGKSTFNDIKTGSFKLVDLGESDIAITDLDCDSFNIDRFEGKTQLSLKRLPTEESSIRTKIGEIEIILSEAENYTLFTKSFNSKLINKIDNTELNSIREGKKIVHNKGSATISVQTHSGNIVITNQ